jgi:hypothetical protein
MYEQLIIATYVITTIGYLIEIYSLYKYKDDKPTNVCLWTANGTASTIAFFYCFENGYTYLLYLFVIQYAFCSLCLIINIYYAYIKGCTNYIIDPQRVSSSNSIEMVQSIYDIYPNNPLSSQNMENIHIEKMRSMRSAENV